MAALASLRVTPVLMSSSVPKPARAFGHRAGPKPVAPLAPALQAAARRLQYTPYPYSMEDQEGYSDMEDYTIADWSSDAEDSALQLSNLRTSDHLGYSLPCYSMESMATASFDLDDLLEEKM